MAMENLSLKALGNACGVQTSSGAGGTGTALPITLSLDCSGSADPEAPKVGSLINAKKQMPSTYSSHSGNYRWEEWFNVETDLDHTDEFTVNSGSNSHAHGLGAATCSVVIGAVSSDVGPCTIRARCQDGYNVNATNYDTWLYWEFEIQVFIGRSDERWKQNIEYVGVSPSGLPIYEWDYIDEINAPGRHTGTIAQSLIERGREDATEKDKNGYY